MKSTDDEPPWITTRERTRMQLSGAARDAIAKVARHLDMPKEDVIDALLRAHSFEDLVSIVGLQREQDGYARAAWSRGRV